MVKLSRGEQIQKENPWNWSVPYIIVVKSLWNPLPLGAIFRTIKTLRHWVVSYKTMLFHSGLKSYFVFWKECKKEFLRQICCWPNKLSFTHWGLGQNCSKTRRKKDEPSLRDYLLSWECATVTVLLFWKVKWNSGCKCGNTCCSLTKGENL